MDKQTVERNKYKKMRREIARISNYHALIISSFYMSICLAISFLLFSFVGFTESALYIFLILNLMPAILTHIIKDIAGQGKNHFLKKILIETPFILSNLKRKYRYTKLKFITKQISYFVTLFLLLLWQYNYTIKGGIQANFTYLPTAILISSILIRILGTLFYYWKLPHDLTHNRI